MPPIYSKGQLIAETVKAANANGIDPQLFVKQIRQESGFDPHARSGAGAEGIAQIVPRWHRGVNTWDPVASLNYAAKWMGQLVNKYNGSYEQALSVYNSGRPDAYKDPNFAKGQTYRYVQSILGGQNPPAEGSTAATAGLDTAQTAVPPSPVSSLVPDTVAMNLTSGLSPQQQLSSLVTAVASQPRSAPLPVPAAATPPSGGAGTVTPGKWVTVAGGANRAGQALHPEVTSFVSQIAQTYGKPLTIGTGTNHNQYVAGTHRESDHWTGWGADIPAKGAALTKLGQAALVAAGADPGWAAKQKGGLFNIGGYQVIFNSNTGGNHFNHLHVGLRNHGGKA